MVIRATSDLHLSARTADVVMRALDALLADAAEHGGPTVIVGDVLDQAISVHGPSFMRLWEKLRSFPDEVYVIVGNHDQFRTGHPDNPLDVLNGDNIVVVRQALHTPHLGLMVAYHEPREFVSLVANMKQGKSQRRWWWTHQGWKGSYLNAMRKDRDGVSLSHISADLVVSGHYHMPQNLGPLLYCGSPYQTSYAEEGQEKGWLRWEGDNLLPERVAYGDLGAPRHWTVRLTDGDLALPPGWREGDKVRVVTDLTRAEVKQHAPRLKKAGLQGASIVAKPSVRALDRALEVTGTPRDAAREHFRASFPDLSPDADAWAEEHDLWS